MSVKERMIRSVHKAEAKGDLVSPERAIRLGVSRAFEDELGWRIGVIGVGLVQSSFEETLAQFNPDCLTLELKSENVVGFIAVDGDTRSAIIEVLTCHSALPRRANNRLVTKVDAALVAPILEKVLANAAVYALGTEIEGWLTGTTLGNLVHHVGHLEARLQPLEYRTVQVSLDFGVGERQGQLFFALLVPQRREVEAAPEDGGELGKQLSSRIRQTSITLEAILHRFNRTGDQISAFSEGDEIVLDGADLARVGIFAASMERAIGNARLGQINGMKAIRFEPIAPHALEHLQMLSRESEGPPTSVALAQKHETDSEISSLQDP